MGRELVEVVVDGLHVDGLGDVPVGGGERERLAWKERSYGSQRQLLIVDPWIVGDGVELDDHWCADGRPAQDDADRVDGAGALVDVQR